jgi:hypothetical protein
MSQQERDELPNLTGIMPVFEAYERGEPIILGNGATLVKCEHVIRTWKRNDAGLVGIRNTYCPKCGEKL